jgi:hypothetical protein
MEVIMPIESESQRAVRRQADAETMKQKALALSAALRSLQEEVELQREKQEREGGLVAAASLAEAAEIFDRMTGDLENAAIVLIGAFYHRDRSG